MVPEGVGDWCGMQGKHVGIEIIGKTAAHALCWRKLWESILLRMKFVPVLVFSEWKGISLLCWGIHKIFSESSDMNCLHNFFSILGLTQHLNFQKTYIQVMTLGLSKCALYIGHIHLSVSFLICECQWPLEGLWEVGKWWPSSLGKCISLSR